jgi:hypothetical protein
MTSIFLQIPDGWKEVDQPERFVVAWKAKHGEEVPVPRIFQSRDKLTVLMGREPYANEDWRWHLSIRYGDPGLDGRIPTWEELVNTAHELRPGVPFVIGIPPRSWWMSVHPHVLHIVETKDEAMVEMWRNNARGDRPT